MAQPKIQIHVWERFRAHDVLWKRKKKVKDPIDEGVFLHMFVCWEDEEQANYPKLKKKKRSKIFFKDKTTVYFSMPIQLVCMWNSIIMVPSNLESSSKSFACLIFSFSFLFLLCVWEYGIKSNMWYKTFSFLDNSVSSLDSHHSLSFPSFLFFLLLWWLFI